jgi:hypothetical protein
MKGTDILRFQLNGSLNLVGERLQAVSDGEWDQRALPNTNKLGFTLWHCARIVDWTIHSAMQGSAEVADREPWSSLFPAEAYYGAGISATTADSVTARVTRADAARYLSEVREAALHWLDGQSDSSLDAITPLRQRQATRAGYLEPSVWAEVESLDNLPAWQVLARPAVAHVRVHMGEYDTLLNALRAGARRIEA